MKSQSKESMKTSEMTSGEKNTVCITVSFSTKKPMVYFGFEQKSTKAPQKQTGCYIRSHYGISDGK